MKTENIISASLDAFGVRRKSSLSPIAHQGVLMFDDVIRNVTSSNFNSSSCIFSVPPSHSDHNLYWMHVSIEASPHKSSHVHVYNTPLVYLMRPMPGNKRIMFSNALVVKLKPNLTVSINSNITDSFSDFIAYWSSFQLNNLMHPLTVVFATCCRPSPNTHTKLAQNTNELIIKILYDTALINEGEVWNIRSSSFTARHSGIYVFSVDATFEPTSNSDNKAAANLPKRKSLIQTVIYLHINKANSTVTNNKKQLSVGQISMHGQSGTRPASNAVSASCLVDLSETDAVDVWLHKDYNWLPGITETAVSAFYYSPISNLKVLKKAITKIICRPVR